MAENIPQKGGIYLPGGLAPLDQIMGRALLPIGQQAYAASMQEEKPQLPPYYQMVYDALTPMLRELHYHYQQQYLAHQETLRVLTAITKGELKPNQVAVTDEGWTLRKPRPGQKEAEDGNDVASAAD